MNAQLERTTKVVSAKYAQKERFKIKRRRQTVNRVLEEQVQKKEHTAVDVSAVILLQVRENLLMFRRRSVRLTG